MKHKKGSIFDVLILAIILLAMTMFIVFGYKLMTTINTDFQANADLSTASKGHISDLKGRFVNLFDGIFLTVVIFLSLVIAVGVYFLDLHPIFYIPSIFVIIFVIIVSAAFANVFNDVTDASDIQAEADEFTLMPFIMKHFVKFIAIIGFLIVIAMYAKQRMQG